MRDFLIRMTFHRLTRRPKLPFAAVPVSRLSLLPSSSALAVRPPDVIQYGAVLELTRREAFGCPLDGNPGRFPINFWLLGALLLGVGSLQAADQMYSDIVSSTPPAMGNAYAVTPSTPAAIPLEPFVSPLGKKGKVLSGFGRRHVPNSPTKMEVHAGVDYRCAPGTLVRAARSGKVIFAGFSTAYVSRTDKTDKSRLVILLHADKTSSRYVHLNTLKVKQGQMVKSGQALGTSAESEEWSEPVLHFEIRSANGKPLDPEDVIEEPSAK